MLNYTQQSNICTVEHGEQLPTCTPNVLFKKYLGLFRSKFYLWCNGYLYHGSGSFTWFKFVTMDQYLSWPCPFNRIMKFTSQKFFSSSMGFYRSVVLQVLFNRSGFSRISLYATSSICVHPYRLQSFQDHRMLANHLQWDFAQFNSGMTGSKVSSPHHYIVHRFDYTKSQIKLLSWKTNLTLICEYFAF